MFINIKKNQGFLLVLLIAILTLLVHFLTYNNLGFHRDELLYLSLGRHLATGYWSNPPLIGLISYLSQLLPGDELFATRLFPSLAGGLLVILVGLITCELGGKTYAQILACLAVSCSLLILRGFSMLQPVPFDILFWTLILYWFLRYINTGKPLYMLLLGVGFGLGLLNKYMVVFLAAGLAFSLLFTPYRRLWINKYTWLAALIALVIFLPNLIWQINHHFPVLHHMQELKETQLVNVKRANILIDQLLMFTFGSVVWVSGLIWLLINRNAARFRIFALVYLTILLTFLVLRGKSYYMAGLYPFMFAAGGVSLEGAFRSAKSRAVVLALIVFFSLLMAPGGIPLMPAEKLAAFYAKIPPEMGAEALLRWEDGEMHALPQDFADMLGWDELGNMVVKACDTIQDKHRILIYTDNYGQAGAIDRCGRCHNLPEAVSFSDSYLMWMPDTVPSGIDKFFYVNGERGSDLDSLFADIDSLGSITNPYARERGTTVYLYQSPRPDFREFLSARVKEVKDRAFSH